MKQVMGYGAMRFANCRSVVVWMALIIGFVGVSVYFYYPRDPALTTDSMEYLARRYASPLHPHHLLWSYVLWLGRVPFVFIFPQLDAIKSAQLFQSVVSAWGVVAFGLVLYRKGGLNATVSAAWACLFAVSAGYSALAQETESYNAAIAMCLSSILLLPSKPCITRKAFWAAVILFCLAICNHQKFALAVIPFLFFYWYPRKLPPPAAGVIFAASSGALCLVAYLVAHRFQEQHIPFTEWLVLYSERMPVFGKPEHLVQSQHWYQLIANLLSAIGGGPGPFPGSPAPAQETLSAAGLFAMRFGYVLWFFLAVSAGAGLLSVQPLYRFFAAWFILFELFLWYWAPWLLQMQVLSIPAAIGVAALAIDYLMRRFNARTATILSIAIILPSIAVIVFNTRIANPPHLGHLTLEEAKDFYAHNDVISSESPRFMILYGYSESRAYMILPGRKTASYIAVIENSDSEPIRRSCTAAAMQTAAGVINDNGVVLIHKSMLLEDEGECGVLSLVKTISQLAGVFCLKSDLQSTSDGHPVALTLCKPADSDTDGELELRLKRHSTEFVLRSKLKQKPVPCSR